MGATEKARNRAGDDSVHVDRDGRIQPDDTSNEVSPIARDTDPDDSTASGAAVGGVVGAGLGAVIGGPVGAIIGAVAGAGAGKAAEEANREDPNVPTGNPTDSDSHKTKHDYFAGQVYEEGSLADVRVKRARDLQADETPATPAEGRS
jgi:uncharacterized protein YcfJ